MVLPRQEDEAGFGGRSEAVATPTLERLLQSQTLPWLMHVFPGLLAPLARVRQQLGPQPLQQPPVLCLLLLQLQA